MRKSLGWATCIFGLLASSAALAGEKTITLSVQNMDCAACPYVVRGSLEAVPGVQTVHVSFQDKTAVVTFDDTRADVKVLTTATAKAGYPSAPRM